MQPTSTPTRTRLPLLAGLVLGVLLGHALLLAGLPAWGPSARAAAVPLNVRQIAPAPMPPATAAPVPRPATNPPPAPVRPQRPPLEPAAPEAPMAPPAGPAAEAVPVAAQDPAAAESNPAPAPAPESDGLAPPAEPVVDPQLALAAAASRPSAPEADEEPPVFATRLPPAAVLHYELRRGVLSGQGVMNWHPGADGYELDIVGSAFGLELLSWSSRGGYDAAGLAPLRFVDRRRGRAAQAANFQRGKGLISWSSVTTTVPLAAGAQDRLSWMVQVPAIVEAAPARFVAGERIPMLVTGARGDADVWTFAVVGVEDVEVVGTRIEGALALRREPRKPHDTKVEVWLDPARRHLPVRVKLSSAEGGDGLEFVLKP
jgi:hypothetical protein